jgi:hypothetical protein
MIAPLLPYAIKGAIWYQGEANVRDAILYEQLFPTMIQNWRDDWGQDFPFYFVQLAPFNYNTPIVGAALRDAQRKTLSLKNTGMAVTLDIGNPTDIHPKNKQDVGKRLALWAMANDYNKKDLVFSGPLFKSMQIEGKKARITFDHIGSGLVVKGKILTHFEIAGGDQVFFPAKAEIKRNTVFVSAKEVKKPVAVRYAFTNSAEPNLFNKEGLPASSFRTDDWTIIAIPVRISGRYSEIDEGFQIELKSDDPSAEIRYTTDGSEPTLKSNKYHSPLSLKKTVLIKARAFKNGTASLAVAENKFTINLATGKKIILAKPYSKKYPASGKMAMVDGITGSSNFHDGVWQGYERIDFDATIDLGESRSISHISVGFIQEMKSWIFLPKEVTFEGSRNGQTFNLLGTLTHEVELSTPGSIVKSFTLGIEKTKARFVRVRAKNVGICPDWHPGAGGKAWLFVDEIVIE